MQCLESIANQTYRDFELILVDDGSPDSCGAMCDAFAQAHPNTKVIHQKNMGLSEARNQGVLCSKGEYITFIDSDDYVAPDYLEYLLNLAEKYQADVSAAKLVLFWDDKLPTIAQKLPQEQVFSRPEALSAICYGSVSICACGKLYRRHLVEKHPYPAGELYEDTATTHRILGDANAMAYGSHGIYFWRQRSGSITHAVVTEKHFFGITAAKKQIAYMEEHCPEAIPAAQTRCVMKIVDLSYRLVMGRMDHDLFRRMREEIKPLLRPLLQNKRVGLSLRVRAVMLYLGYVPYRMLSGMYALVKRR